ncbi:hypothetical protein ABZ565_10220 [Streptomyces sp. NPDC016469]|uniref:hypothetical protein n=1 Tax=Streptomyces sp. NPDC016469 TaxID=3157191 RepID=UPI0033C23C17
MRRFELAEWKRSPRLTDLRNTVVGLLAEGRHRTALDEALRGLRRDPEHPDGLFVALSVLAQSRTTRLASPEPLTETQQWNALLAPITTTCSACDSRWYSTHAVLFADNDVQIHPTNPIGLQCQKCRYTLCRDCLKAQRPVSHTATVDAPEVVAGSCANTGCGGRGLSAPVLPTGRPDVTPMDPDAIEGVLVVRDGPIRPTTDEALAVVTRFLPLIPDDAPLLHIRRARPGTMGDDSARDGLARALLLDLEREGVLAPAAWGRSRRMHVLAGPGGDADYLIVPVRRSHGGVSPAAPHDASRPGTYTYLLQILPLRGGWATLRDPRTGDFHEGTFGALSAPAGSLPGVAQEIIERFARMGRSRRVMFFEGDRTQHQNLTTDDVYGIVTEGSASLSPYSEGP